VPEPSGSWLRTAVASLVVCAAAGGLLAYGTDGFQVFTSEQARRNAIARTPKVLPDVELEDQNGRPFTLASYHGRPVAVNFVYTQCRSVCPLASREFELLDRAQRSRSSAADGRLQLISISFDPRDTPARLREYASRYHADGLGWRFARLRETRDLGLLLGAFGIIVIPAASGDFQHNAAVHLVDAEGRLARVLDPDAAPDQVARALADMASSRDLAAKAPAR
jgi:protein SCO1/2